jgi:hypothetical protein
MEEKENKNQEQAKPQPLTYEQLNVAAHQLSEQNAQLRNKLVEISNSTYFKRLDYLFKVLDYSNKFPNEFLQATVNAIVDMMTIKEQPKESKPS